MSHQTAFGCSPTQIGLLFLVVVVPNAIGSGVVGHLADKYSKTMLISVGLCALAATIPLLAVFHRGGQLLYFSLVLFVVGVAASIPMTPILPLLSSIVSAKRSRSFANAYATFVMGYTTGTLVGPIVAASIYNYGGFAWTMGASALLVVTGVGIMALNTAAYADTPASGGGGAVDSTALVSADTSQTSSRAICTNDHEAYQSFT